MELEKALKVYDFLSGHIPEDGDNLHPSSYVYNIVRSIRENGKDGDLITLAKMLDENVDTSSPDEIIQVLYSGFSDMSIKALVSFLEELGYGR